MPGRGNGQEQLGSAVRITATPKRWASCKFKTTNWPGVSHPTTLRTPRKMHRVGAGGYKCRRAERQVEQYHLQTWAAIRSNNTTPYPVNRNSISRLFKQARFNWIWSPMISLLARTSQDLVTTQVGLKTELVLYYVVIVPWASHRRDSRCP